MIFSDAMDAVRSTLSEDTDLTPYDNLNAAYTEFEEATNSKVAGLTQQIAELQAEITELKSVNYDLLMASSGAEQDAEDEETEDAGEDDNADENIDEFLERTAQ